MHVISKKALREFWELHPDAEGPLMDWYEVACGARWRNISELRHVFPHADALKVKSGRTVTVFNIGGNKYRLIASIHYNRWKVYVLGIFTHRQYDRGSWKEQL